MQINDSLRIADLKPQIERLFECSGQKILAIEDTWLPENGTPVFTVAGYLHDARLDGMDTGVPIRFRHPPIRCHWR